MTRPVSVLCIRRPSSFEGSGAELYDKARGAETFPGGTTVVAMPPCKQWCRMRTWAIPDEREKAVGLLCADLVRRWGGILEQPAHSALFREAMLPQPGCDDGIGFTISVPQWWWGHRAEKMTWLYICGIPAAKLPKIPFRMGMPTHVVSGGSRNQIVLSKAGAEETPPLFAKWLIRAAELTQEPQCEARKIEWSSPRSHRNEPHRERSELAKRRPPRSVRIQSAAGVVPTLF